MLLWSSRMKYCTGTMDHQRFRQRSRLRCMVSMKDNARTLYMPLWDVAELVAAIDLLKTSIPGETIERRFAIFGGVARGCITLNEAVVSRRIRELQREINDIDSLYVGMANLKML
ncbi:hypothetical protein JG687_00011312 [Phytophthora cactorum]|uniref:Uncharacterized protein n=1 Tax=Phytophthora cactorum TaxID=29920 RepID=A0A8T1U8U0_9STRA|nr:hypothetical protein JG687_00011312 [Phytophthora cactorum]